MYFCMAASEDYFVELLNLIGSIHKVNFDDIVHIAVFDLGMTNDQIVQLKSIEKLEVYEVEKTNPEILTPFYSRPNSLRVSRGWYSWKPVIIKQSLDMFPYVLYLDAGVLVFQKLDPIFRYIQKEGFFACNEMHDIAYTTTLYVKEALQLAAPNRAWILSASTSSIHSAAIGASQKVYSSYILPLYQLTKEIKYFADDGTAPGGFGWGRHDQTVFSIFVRLQNLKTVDPLFFLEGKEFYIAGDSKKFSAALKNSSVREKMLWGHIRKKIHLNEYQAYIHYK